MTAVFQDACHFIACVFFFKMLVSKLLLSIIYSIIIFTVLESAGAPTETEIGSTTSTDPK